MASGDFADMQSRALRWARYTDDATNQALAADYINDAYISIAADGNPWDWLEFEGQLTLTASADLYTYAAIATALSIDGIKEIQWLINDTTGYGPLHSMSWAELERISASTLDGDGESEPTMWAKYVDAGTPKIRLYPKPIQAYVLGVKGIIQPAELSADGDTPLIPLPWRQRILTRYAAIEMLRERGGGEFMNMADRHQAMFDRDYLTFRRTYASAKMPTFNVMSPNFGNDLPSIDHYDTPIIW